MSIIHIIAHSFNYIKLDLWNSGVTYTGFALIVVLGLLCFTVLIRTYHRFIISHIYLFLMSFFLLFYHQSFCAVIKNKQCEILLSIPILTTSITIYIINYVYNYIYYYKPINITKFSDNIIQLTLPITPNDKYYKIWICCPEISLFEWHPFSLVNDKVYIKLSGNWTSSFFKLVGIEGNCVFPCVYPKLLLMRKSIIFPNNILQLLSIPSVFICSGIGLTTFIGLLNIVVVDYTLNILVITKSLDDINWCLDIITNISKRNTNIFFTFAFTDTIFTVSFDFDCNIIYSRPDIHHFIENCYISNKFSRNLNVLYSGPNIPLPRSKKYNIFTF
jgi:hypothetical protein